MDEERRLRCTNRYGLPLVPRMQWMMMNEDQKRDLEKKSDEEKKLPKQYSRSGEWDFAPGFFETLDD